MSEYVTTLREFEGKLWMNPACVKTAEEIIRCKNCKYSEDNGDYCSYWYRYIFNENGFCSWAIKKDNNERT